MGIVSGEGGCVAVSVGQVLPGLDRCGLGERRQMWRGLSR